MGTYSAFVRFHDGYAVTVDINVGSMNPHEAEVEALTRRRAQIDKLLTPADDACFKDLVTHYLAASHPYRRYLPLLRRGPGLWESPEEMWASELTTHATRIPLPPKGAPAVSAWPRPGHASLYLYLSAHQSYHLRSVIIGHLVASQLTQGGLPAGAGRNADLRDEIQAFLEERNSHTLVGLLSAARADVPGLARLGAPVKPADPEASGGGGEGADKRIAAAALILKAAVEGTPVGADFEAHAARLGESHRVGLLLAILTPDGQWESVRSRFEGLLDILKLP